MRYALCAMPYALCPVVPHLSEKGYNIKSALPESGVKSSQQLTVNHPVSFSPESQQSTVNDHVARASGIDIISFPLAID